MYRIGAQTGAARARRARNRPANWPGRPPEPGLPTRSMSDWRRPAAGAGGRELGASKRAAYHSQEAYVAMAPAPDAQPRAQARAQVL